MKYLCLYIFITKFVLVISSEINGRIFLPNLLVGEYRVYFKAIIPCNSLLNHSMQHNFYLSKTSSNTTELKGNITYLIPFSDDLTMHMNMAIKDSVGGWKDNAHLLISPKACSSMKNIFGTEFPILLKSFGIQNLNCPIAPGVYVLKGYDLTYTILRSNFPKRFFYGTYKTRFQYTDKHNNEVGCESYVIDVKRPWEND